MNNIIYIGMDVHTSNYTLCAFSLKDQKPFCQTQIAPEIKYFEKYMNKLKELNGKDVHFVCGYEAGCLGYSLYYEIKKLGYQCVILAPTTMAKSTMNAAKKNDKRDAIAIAQCLAYNTYSPVYVPSPDDEAVRAYLRMRDDILLMLNNVKRELISFCVLHGYNYKKDNKRLSYWTKTHLDYLDKIKFEQELLNDTLNKYIETKKCLETQMTDIDKKLEVLANDDRYHEKICALRCFRGIDTFTALSLLCEVSDFNRFPTADHFASYLGLVPGERSSGNHIRRTCITKAGNGHLRRLLTEGCQAYAKAKTYKSKQLRRKQSCCTDAAKILYADRCNDRLLVKYWKMTNSGRVNNVAKTAVARELACFIWGMITGHTA